MLQDEDSYFWARKLFWRWPCNGSHSECLLRNNSNLAVRVVVCSTIFCGRSYGYTASSLASMPSRTGLPPFFYSSPVFVNSKVSFTGVSTTVFSVEQAIDVLDAIGAQEDSEDCLPFAVTLVENGELISIAEDNGEFGAGELLSDSLNCLDGFNAVVCCTRKVSGCYVSEIVQPQKLRCIREAAVKSLEALYEHLRPQGATGYDSIAAAEIRTEKKTLAVKKISLLPPKLY